MDPKEHLQMSDQYGADFLTDYEKLIETTDKLDENSDHFLLFGLFGEVGSILTVSKKAEREQAAFNKDISLIEELGDALWYFARICARKNTSISEVVENLPKPNAYQIAPTEITNHPIAYIPWQVNVTILEASRRLGNSAASLLVEKLEHVTNDMLSNFFNHYLEVVSASGASFKSVITRNLEKSLGRFAPIEYDKLIDFDIMEHIDEQLPRKFKIEITQRTNGKTYMKKDGVFIGDPLTDNIAITDGYRFHDVFHMAYASILHWSPVFRSLLKNKRKGNPEKDESEDGGRAIVIEEGLSAWIFSIAKEKKYFAGQDTLSFDILKTVKQFIKGYEVENCPYNLIEKAILDGYTVFRELKKHERGYIIGCRMSRTLTFTPYDSKNDA